MGLRPSVFLDFGSVFGVRRPTLTTLADFRDPADGLTKYLCRNSAQGTTQFANRGTDDDGNPVGGYTVCPERYSSLAPFEKRLYRNSWNTRVSLGACVNWHPPFAPLLLHSPPATSKQEVHATQRLP